jgi:hypothetical protein
MLFDRSVSGFHICHVQDADVAGGLQSHDVVRWLAGLPAGAAGLSRIAAR